MALRRKYSLIRPAKPNELYDILKTFYVENGCDGVSCDTCKLNKELIYLGTTKNICGHISELTDLMIRLEEK